MNPTDPHASRTETALRTIRLRRAQRALDHMFHALPLAGRLRTGAFMALKTALSACVAYAIGHALHTEQAFWAAITAVAVTQPHFGDTQGASRDRCMGTAFGGIAGLLGLWAGGSGLLPFMLALCLVTLACWTFNAGSAARIGGITTAIVVLVPSVGPRWEIPLYRLGEVILGTLCALAVGWLVSRIEERSQRKEEAEAP